MAGALLPCHFPTGDRLVVGVPNPDPAVFESVVECMAPPYYLLYILHTSRGEGQPGRCQSPALALTEFKGFLSQFSSFLSADGRFDWAHSPADNGTVVWDRHDQLFAYGPLDRFASALLSLGFTEGPLHMPVPHEHYYRPEFDHLANELMASMHWQFSPLRTGDEQ